MEKRSSYLSSLVNLASARAIQAPQRHEGIGNALRAAFDPGSYGLPDEMMTLLDRIDRKRRG